ncbi:zinc-dependent metalloprotease [Flavobacterium sp.]|uniref:zinc-dependent metalloprotease n=1 Tax=Flavobacterium sp. TaxID=239 RepID=UPI00286E0C5E|nr:zinc-dependent metalloprotease [Flavobacterium sp.]
MKIKLILALLLFQLGFSQHKSCGTDAQMQKMMSDPVAKQKYLDLQNRFEIELAKLQDPQNELARSINATIIIPVAVHFPEVVANSPDKPCLRQLAQNQIDILNADFNATNADVALWTTQVQAFYPGTNVGNFNVQFVLATKNHPSDAGLSDGQQAITFGTAFLYTHYGDNRDIRWKGYLNIVVREICCDGTIGYYAGGTPDEGNLIVLKKDAIGSGAGCEGGYVPYWVLNKGRNADHELGHYFNVHHTFGRVQGGNVCAPSNTDEVDDTPQCTGSGGWPAPGSVAGCVPGEKSLTMNYMDYTYDSNKFMFTSGQVVRMRAYYNAVANQFKTNVLSNNDFEFKNFALFPNPNTGSFKISFTPETDDEIEIIVYDISGRNIYNKSFLNSGMFNQELQLNNISSGSYIVTIKNGENKTARRIIVD